MGVFGFQLISTLICAAMMTKFGRHFNSALFFLSKLGLKFISSPTDTELANQIASSSSSNSNNNMNSANKGHSTKRGAPHNSTTSSNNNNKKLAGGGVGGVFSFPRSTHIRLDAPRAIKPSNHSTNLLISQQQHAGDIQWLLDITLFGFALYAVNSVYLRVKSTSFIGINKTTYKQKGGIGALLVNPGLVWMCVALVHSCITLYRMARLYAQVYARSVFVCVCSAAALLSTLLATCCLVLRSTIRANEDLLHLQLAVGSAKLYLPVLSSSLDDSNFQSSPSITLASIQSQLQPIRIALVCISALIAPLLVFPALELARLYALLPLLASLESGQSDNDQSERELRESEAPIKRRILIGVAHLSFFLPGALCLIWTRPDWPATLIHDLIGSSSPTKTASLTRMSALVGGELTEWSIRICMMAAIPLCAALSLPLFLQTHLFKPIHSLKRIQSEAGRWTNQEMRRIINQPIKTLSFIALHLITPMLMIGQLTLICSHFSANPQHTALNSSQLSQSNSSGTLSSNSALFDWLLSSAQIESDWHKVTANFRTHPLFQPFFPPINVSVATTEETANHIGDTTSSPALSTSPSNLSSPFLLRSILAFILWMCCATFQVLTLFAYSYHRIFSLSSVSTTASSFSISST